MSRAFTENINSFNVSNNIIVTTPDYGPEILAWLSPLEPQMRHEDIRNQRVDGIGNWLLETKVFRNWYNGSEEDGSDHAALLCYGDPGVGKSYISSVVVDHLCDQAVEQDMAVACFYYDFASREEQSPINMLGSLLKQLVSALESIPVEIKRTFRGQKKVIGGRGPQLLDIVNMFPHVSSFQRIFICVDALDECVPKHQLQVLVALEKILQKSPNIRIFMTGRPQVMGAVEKELGRRARGVSIKPKDDDMVAYLCARLRNDTTPEVMDSGLEMEILKGIPREIPETFLLASLKVDAILRETAIHRRRERLNTMGDGLGLGDAYEGTLERIRAQDGEMAKLAITAMMWICHSERPLHVNELRHALAVEIGSASFKADNLPATKTLLASCQGLVTVDKEASTVRLIHHTLREYLSITTSLFPQAQLVMAETCLTYLNSDRVKAISIKRQPDLSSMPFLKYCSRYWGIHANRELSDATISLAMNLLDTHENHVASKSLLEQLLDPDEFTKVNAAPLFSGLHCASFFGILEVMIALLGKNGCDANQGDSFGATPLIWAVRGGRDEAVKLLLEQETVDPNKPNSAGNTPLAWAAFEGNVSIVRQLLDLECVNSDGPDKRGRTPLWWAAYKGHEAVVKQVLDREDINPDRPDNEGNTPLSRAAFGGHEQVVKQLLNLKAVNPNNPGNEGITPLSWAAIQGHESVVGRLLDRGDVSPDKPDKKGNTPLCWAAIQGQELVVRLLLDRGGAGPGRPNKDGTTPLSLAAFKGHKSVIKQLLDQKGVTPDKPDKNGITPLSRAAYKGHESVVEQLLERGDVNPDRPDNKGNTPLSWAAVEGHESVVKQLLSLESVGPDKPNNSGNTPLSRAAHKGHELVVTQLLDREDVSPDKPNNNGSTPLSRAAYQGHESVVRQLLDREDVNPDRPDNEGNTPLSWAAVEGHESVVKQLFSREDLSPDKPNNSGNTPLSRAAFKGHWSVVKIFLGRGDVNPDMPDNMGNTPLSRAANEGHESAVKELLGRKDVNPDKPDNCGITPLSRAAYKGHKLVVKQLLDQEGVNPDLPDNNGMTPLSWAARKGHGPIVNLLLGRQDVDPQRPDKNGHIPLFHATRKGHQEVVDLLQGCKSPIRAHSEVDELQASLP